LVADVARLLKHPVVSLTAGAAASVVGGAVATYRTCEELPVVGPWLRSGVTELSRRGEQLVAQGRDPVKALVAAIGAQLVELVLDQVDLTALVRERVDINAIAAEIDVDAILTRIDLIALANEVIYGVDLPAIIRESTDSVTAEVMTDVRTQGERADDVVSGFFDRMLGRGQEPQ
jgi:hypothetical protein